MKDQSIKAELDKLTQSWFGVQEVIFTNGRVGDEQRITQMPYLRYRKRLLKLFDQHAKEARIEELERLKKLLAGFTWGPYNPFETINEEISNLREGN